MTPKKLNLDELLDLMATEFHRGIICEKEFLKSVKEGIIPKMIADIRGDLRMTVERVGEKFNVTKHTTELAMESVGALNYKGEEAKVYQQTSVGIQSAA